MDSKSTIDILLVEDNPDDAELTIHALTESNNDIKLIHLKDGVEALKFIRTMSPDDNRRAIKLVLLDLKLPKMDGLEVLRKIRGTDQTRAMPVVIFTSSRERRDITEAYRLGVNSYVVKPVEFDNYVKTLNTVAFYWGMVNKKPL